MRNSIGMAFRLESDVTLRQWRAVLFHRGVEVVHHTAANLWFFVGQNGLPFYDVFDGRITQDLYFHPDPLIARVGLRARVDAMLGD